MAIFIRLLCCAIPFIFFTGLSNAATTKPYQVRPPLQEYLPVDSSGNILGTRTTYETVATTPNGQQVTRYTTKNTPLSKASLGKMAKGALAGPLGIGITAAIIAADYLIDENTGEISVPSESFNRLGTCSTTATFNPPITQTTFTQCQAQAYSGYAGQLYVQTVNDGAGFCSVYRWVTGTVQPRRYWGIPCTEQSTRIPQTELTTETTPATDSDVGDAIATNDTNSNNKLIPNIIPESIESGRWRDEWPEAVTDSTTINDTLENDIEGATNPTTDPTVTDSSTAAPPPVTVTQPQDSMATEWPLFCDWASYVCDFIDWVKTEPDPPDVPALPVETVEEVEWSSGLGGGSCPANPTFELMGASGEYDLSAICQAATDVFRPLIIFLSLIGAGFTIAGVRR